MVKKEKFVPRGEPTGEKKIVGGGEQGVSLLSQPASSHLRS